MYLDEGKLGLSALKQGSLLAEVEKCTSAGSIGLQGDSSKMLVSVEADVVVPILQQETPPQSPLHTSQR